MPTFRLFREVVMPRLNRDIASVRRDRNTKRNISLPERERRP
jgi:hypothetical protein